MRHSKVYVTFLTNVLCIRIANYNFIHELNFSMYYLSETTVAETKTVEIKMNQTNHSTTK